MQDKPIPADAVHCCPIRTLCSARARRPPPDGGPPRPQKEKKGRVLQGRGTRARRATAQAAGSARSLNLHGGAAMVAGVRRWLRPPACVCRRRSAAELVGTLTVQGLHPIEQINRCCFRSVDDPKETLGNAIKLPPWYESRRAEIVAALAPLRRSPARQRVAGRWSRKILFCASGARFIPSLRAWSRSNYVCARRRGGHEAFIAGGYRREYWR